MTVYDLMNQLQEALEDDIITHDTEIAYAAQPRWAFEYTMDEEIHFVNGKVYIKEGNQTGYLPQGVREEIGW